MNIIETFLNERFELRWKSEQKKTNPREEHDVRADYRIDTWVESAAARAKQISVVSHPGKFSHSDAKITPILCTGDGEQDDHENQPYLHSGVIRVQNDVLGNAAALDVYAFLSLMLDDGQTVLFHFQNNSPSLEKLLGVDDEKFERWRTQFETVTTTDSADRTDHRIKQVYFPVDEDYHLLSILTSSGLVAENRNRIVELTFGDETKTAKDCAKNGKPSETGYRNLPNLLTQHYGGTQPQNVSRLNSQNAGRAELLPCIPPMLSPTSLRIPKKDFFDELYGGKQLSPIFLSLHQLFRIENYNNQDIRGARKHWTESLFEYAFYRAAILQNLDGGWTDAENISLPSWQRCWLDQKYFKQLSEHLDWQDDVAESLARWTVVQYRRSRRKNNDTVVLAETEEKMFAKEAKQYARRFARETL